MNKKIVKGMTMAAALVMASSVFSGCSKEVSKSKKNGEKALDKDAPITITIWHYYNGVQQTKFDEMVKEFNNTVGLEKGIIVQAFTKNGVDELADNVIASVNKEPGAEEAPDIFACYADNAYTIDQKGMLADLSKYFSDKELSEYVNEYIDEGKLNGKSLKIFPTAKSSEVMILNKTDWQKFADAKKVSYDDLKTWESLIEVSEKYYDYTDELTPDVPNDGKAFFGRDALANYITIGAKQLGCTLVDVDKDGNAKLALDKDVIKKLWQNYYVPYVKGYFTAESRFRSDDAKIGKIIALIGSTPGSSYYPKEVTVNDETTYPIENVVLPVPNFEGKEPYVVQQGAGMSVVKSDEKTEYACSVFLKWFTEADRNIDFSVDSGYLPVKKEANDIKKIEKVINSGGSQIDPIISDTIKVAVEAINDSDLYTAPPFNHSSDFRNALSSNMETTAQADHEAAYKRIENGEDRKTVLDEYTNDKAFEKWYKNYESQLKKSISD